jgi:hypothetical protein
MCTKNQSTPLKTPFTYKKSNLLATCFGLNIPLSSDDPSALDGTFAMRYGQIGIKFTHVVCKKCLQPDCY